MADAIKVADIGRMLSENLQQRERIAELLRAQIEVRRRELPLLEGMLASLEECGLGHPDAHISLASMGASPAVVGALRGALDDMRKTEGGE